VAKEEFLKPFRIAEIIRSEIRELPVHEVIPTERQMAERFGVSRVTIQKALGILERDGLIYRRHGAGSFVSPVRESRSLQLRSFTEEMALRGESIETQIIDVALIDEVNDKSDAWSVLSRSTYRIERLRLRKHQPIAWDITYISKDVAPGLERFNLGTSLYEVLEKKFKLTVRSADESISPIITNLEVAEMLGLRKGAPALQFIRTGYDSRGKLIESTRSIRRTDQWQFKYTVRR
jgi:GntR family transcriptional regulator